MSPFGKYAEFYDPIYKDKDYEAEAKFVHQLVQRHAPGARSILDLGCGTGKHATHFAQLGYTVQGVDKSGPMIAIARARQKQLDHDESARLGFMQGDIRTIRLEAQYDVVVCLFHVLSYQTTDQDVTMALETIAHHLSPKGICLFDFWYGPAILSSPPTVRLKRLQKDSLAVLRISEPMLQPNENVVDVKYLFFVRDGAKENSLEEFHESHRMRYFFFPEVANFLREAGLREVTWGEWLTANAPSLHSWSAYIVAGHPPSMEQD